MNADRLTLEELAAAPVDEEDLRLLAQIAELFQFADPLPVGLVDQIQFGLTLDSLEAEVAQLQRIDSGLVGARSDGPAGAAQIQTVTFTSDQFSLTVSITPSGIDTVRIDGWAAPGDGAVIELKLANESRTVTADEDGRFVIEEVPRGLAKFLITLGSSSAQVVTPAVQL